MAPESNRCKSCGAAIVWASTRAGRLAPIDAEPSAGGTVRLLDKGLRAEALGPLEAAAARAAGESLHRSHFATCPQSANWRRR